jgi:hypothetical protein
MGAGTERAHLRLVVVVGLDRRADIVSERYPDDRSPRDGPRKDRLGDGHLIDRVLRVEHKLSK